MGYTLKERRHNMKNQSRRNFLKKTGAVAGFTALGSVGFPAIVKAQTKEWVLGCSLPLTGPFAMAGALGMPGLTDFIAFTTEPNVPSPKVFNILY